MVGRSTLVVVQAVLTMITCCWCGLLHASDDPLPASRYPSCTGCQLHGLHSDHSRMFPRVSTSTQTTRVCGYRTQGNPFRNGLVIRTSMMRYSGMFFSCYNECNWCAWALPLPLKRSGSAKLVTLPSHSSDIKRYRSACFALVQIV